jgi:hypothetical protein
VTTEFPGQGIYTGVQCTNIVDHGLKVCVVDIGRINPFAFETATVHHEEDRQKRIRGYRTALESLATAIKKTCQLDKFVEYCRKLADQFMTVCYHRRTIKIRERERDQRELGRLVNYICGDGVNVVFVGMRNVNAAKGYAMVPTKNYPEMWERVLHGSKQPIWYLVTVPCVQGQDEGYPSQKREKR